MRDARQLAAVPHLRLLRASHPRFDDGDELRLRTAPGSPAALANAVRWAQTKSMWPDTFGLACCAIEMMSIVSARYDIARFGMEAFRASPRQADLLIVSGRVAHKMAAPLRQIYDQMLEPKWVIAMGA